ncbi:secondary thiamine-phosphate synthase enzyme YjbQ [Acuticoccus sp. MNP-M23]|uniref:secondary thiamine-phosphate synthase enzyme YjbQ n=1 Tax=Acuticoccus sp. MNP-M23 TaxID=3072793 RepID=UPI002815D4F8|nr:secondary thiamine-phosphate synthase enzyme YjbQ [Acuticoccus sp. MNP-M23]WMS43302.1 secondary thiamine-phosphate synthase enzyme YjbQ [Acuticoccus sp. MNP-M23]
MAVETLSDTPVARVVRGRLTVPTRGPGFTDITRDVRSWLHEIGAGAGLLTAFVRHTTASLTIQENADDDVQADLLDSLATLAPPNAGYRHNDEGADDMPGHIKGMLCDVSLAIPCAEGGMSLGTWQGIYLIEHRARGRAREVELAFVG